jgi:hypothetical protein
MKEEKIEVLITHQQDVANAAIAVIVLRPTTSKLHDVLPLAPQTQRALEYIQPGKIVIISP